MRGGLVTAVMIWVLSVGNIGYAQVGDPDVGRDVFEVNCAMCHGQDAGGMMGGDMDGMMGGGMWSWFAWAVLFLIALGAVAIASVFVARAMSGKGRAGGASPSNAMEILDERYARGEIDRDEFEERRRGLGK